MSYHEVTEIDERFAGIAKRVLLSVVIQHVHVEELSFLEGICTICRYNETTLVEIDNQMGNGNSLLVSVLFVRDDADRLLTDKDSVEDRVEEEFLHWYVAEVLISGSLVPMLEMTPAECQITAFQLEELYRVHPWDGCAPAEEGLLVHERMTEVQQRFETLSRFKRFFPLPEEAD